MSLKEVKSKKIDGRLFAEEYLNKVLMPRCETFTKIYKKVPKLSTILVGESPASESYLKLKEKFFAKLCVESEVFRLPEATTEEELITFIDKQNHDDKIDGILVQIPLPSHIDEDTISESIILSKDVEGLSPGNVHAWAKALPNLVPATALGVLALLKFYKIPIEGKHVVVVGRSMIVGKPVAHLLLKENATVTVCHSRSKPLEKYTKQADILIAAVGRPHLIKKGMIKDGAIVIDVGINFEDGKMMGDVDYDDLLETVSYITPVPGGSGPATVCMLASNLLLAFELKWAKENEEKLKCLKDYYANYDTIGETCSCING
ncbi:MAG: bifunctional 5,10-methylenetetrahydrofolate dehydrogenase/5,10-methenyltetrahydrofolate cyclohydrolase [Candidatus Heimdallarchaeota archaeon]|nr:bifunctional 5,10-methylenetetrahydrofolate dehydrogenase/5,10-methenyltetrahydrofolate cyclohydrolase [Candidatus Heimdallarchaeota archaeon]